MSLLFRFPLNGNLTNKGQYEVSLINSNATVGTGTKFNNGYSFNGTSAFLTTNKKCSDLFSNGDSFSISVFVSIVAYPTTQTGIVCCNQYHQQGFGIGLRTTGVPVLMIMGTSEGKEVSANKAIPLNTWTHLAYTYNAENKKAQLYMDGLVIASATPTFNWVSGSNTFAIGKNTQGGWGGFFKGNIKDVRVYNETLSVSEIKEISKDCFVYYDFNYIMDNKCFDSSGNSNTGIINGTSTLSEDTRSGLNSMEFTGTNYINTGIQSKEWGFSNSSKSVEIWTYLNGTDPHKLIGTLNYSWQIRYTGTAIQFIQWDSSGGSSNTMNLSTTVSANAWHHIIVTWDNTKLVLYIDGVAKVTKSATTTATNKIVSDNINIGGNIYKFGSNVSGLNGKIALVKLYDSCLSATDVSDLYSVKGFVSDEGELFVYQLDEIEGNTSDVVDFNGVSAANAFDENPVYRLYSPIEYLTFSGSSTQLIDTGYKPNNNTTVEVKANTTGTGKWIYGGRESTSKNIYGLYINSGTSLWFQYNNGGESAAVPNIINTDRVIKTDKNVLYIDGAVKQTKDIATFQSPVNMYIGTINTNGSLDGRYFTGKIYYFKIWDNGTLVRSYIPCIRKSDNKVGFYEEVNGDFVGNGFTTTLSGIENENYFEVYEDKLVSKNFIEL